MHPESGSGEVFTTCQATGRAIATGIETDAESLNRAPEFVAYVQCPHCGTEHEWSKTTAWFGQRKTAAVTRIVHASRGATG